MSDKKERIAHFQCKGCGEINEKPFPEVRVITEKESCKCGVDAESRIHRGWSIAAAFTISIFILCVFGSCIADDHFTTEQMKHLPDGYKVKVTSTPDINDHSVRKMTREELEREEYLRRIKDLEAALQNQKPVDEITEKKD